MAPYVLVMNTKRYSVEICIPKQYVSNIKDIDKQLIKFADSLLTSNLLNVDYEEIKERMIGIESRDNSEEMEKEILIRYSLWKENAKTRKDCHISLLPKSLNKDL